MKKKTLQLNSEQQEAVSHKDGPALVIAGAGTGKTRVIVERIVSLIDSGIDPKQIVALTFTEKAAQEMVDRVNELRGGFSLDIQIATYNSFGEQLLRRFANDIGMHSTFRLLGDIGQVVFLKQHLDELKLSYYSPVTKPDGMLGELAQYFSQLKQHVVTSESYEKFAESLPASSAAEKDEKARHKELVQAFATYLQLSKQENVIDFDDQIYLLLEIFRTRPNVITKLQSEIQYILVDEFQDTNPMQSRLLLELSGDKNNIMAVGDDDQSIYGFRGATIANILQFDDEYASAKHIVLNQNYRSSQAILDSSYKLIQNNNPDRLEIKTGLDKKLIGQFAGKKPQLQQFERFSDELDAVTKAILGLRKSGVPASEIAVLSRKNSVSLRIHEALTRAGVDARIAGQTHDLYREPLVRAFVDCLQALEDKRNNTALYHTLTGPLFNLDVAELAVLSSRAKREHIYIDDLLGEQPATTQAAQQLATWRQLLSSASVGQLCYRIMVDSGLKERLLSKTGSGNERNIYYISQFFEQLQEFERTSQHSHAASFLENLPLLRALSERSSDDLTDNLDSEAVSVLTIHKSKGLEWDHVFVIDVNEGSLPAQNRRSSLEIPEALRFDTPPDPIHEERRLLYVAATRARKELTLTASFDHGGKLAKKPSRFLPELFDDVQMKPSATNHADQASLDLFAEGSQPESAVPTRLVKDGKLQLTVSQLSDYLRCPYDFYYRHILAVPQEPTATLQIGTILHAAIEKYNRARLNKDELSEDTLFEQILADPPAEGFLSAKERERALQAMQDSLSQFLNKERNETRIPNRIEQAFTIELDAIRIVGRYDAVYDYDDDVEIRDYKSSDTVHDEKRAKSRAQSSDQLTMYAMAWQQMHGQLPQLVSLDFFAKGFVGSVKKTQKGIDTMRSKLEAAAAGITAGDYEAGRSHEFCIHD